MTTIANTPCITCARGDNPHHSTNSPHCQYCGQAFLQGQGVGGFWYNNVYYDGHLKCIFTIGGAELELYYMKLSSNMITKQAQLEHAPVELRPTNIEDVTFTGKESS